MDTAEILTGSRRDLLLICDHASNHVPAELAGLGLSETDLQRHIGWDIGAGPLTRCLSARLNAPAILCRFSRLIIDPNRPIGHPQSIPGRSDNIPVPGNIALSTAEAARRDTLYHRPYHAAVHDLIESLGSPALIAVHSFTPMLNGSSRRWHAAVLHDDDQSLARPMLAEFRRCRELLVGDNEPYSGYSDLTFTLPWHAGRRGLKSAAIEVRQDLIDNSAGVERWADIIEQVLRQVFETAQPSLS